MPRFLGRDLPTIEPRIKRKTIELNNLKLESAAWLFGTNWKVALDVTAIRKNRAHPDQKIIGEVAGFYLIPTENRMEVRDFVPNIPVIVFDSRLNLAGVVTGVIRVVLKEGANSEFLSAVPNVKILDSFPDIRTYFVTSSEVPFNLEKLLNEMRTDSSVQEAHLEILSQNYEKN